MNELFRGRGKGSICDSERRKVTDFGIRKHCVSVVVSVDSDILKIRKHDGFLCPKITTNPITEIERVSISIARSK